MTRNKISLSLLYELLCCVGAVKQLGIRSDIARSLNMYQWRTVTMKTSKVFLGIIGVVVVGTVLGALLTPIKDTTERKSITRTNTEYFDETSERYGSYGIL